MRNTQGSGKKRKSQKNKQKKNIVRLERQVYRVNEGVRHTSMEEILKWGLLTGWNMVRQY